MLVQMIFFFTSNQIYPDVIESFGFTLKFISWWQSNQNSSPWIFQWIRRLSEKLKYHNKNFFAWVGCSLTLTALGYFLTIFLTNADRKLKFGTEVNWWSNGQEKNFRSGPSPQARWPVRTYPDRSIFGLVHVFGHISTYSWNFDMRFFANESWDDLLSQ